MKKILKKKFESTISDKNHTDYKINCRFWKFKEDKVIICNLNENIPKGDYIINLDSTKLTYNNYNIIILDNKYIIFKKLDENIVQLYSNNQNIEVKDGKDSYEVKI